MKCITGGRIILPDSILCGKNLIYDEKIIGISDTLPDRCEVIDAAGDFVSPGFIDIHIHGYLGADTSDGEPDGLFTIAHGIAENGVTAFLPTTMTVSMPEIVRAFDSVRSVIKISSSWEGAQILGVNCEGPFINPAKKGAQLEECVKLPDPGFVLDNGDIIRIVTVAPEVEGGFNFIKKVTENSDITVSAGHSDATYECVSEAISYGLSHITHLFNAMSPLHHRKPGMVGAAFASSVTAELISDALHVHPALFKPVFDLKSGCLALITDCTRAGGMPDGEYTLGGQKIYLKNSSVTLADGTLAGSVLKYNEGVLNQIKYSSHSLPEIISAASLTPAKIAKCDKTKGSLEAGKDADIVIFNDNVDIIHTIISGRTVV